MKKIFFVLFVFWETVLSQVSSTTGNPFYLPQWAAGNKLNAGTQNDSSLANASINSAFARINKIVGRQISLDGYFNTVYGDGTGNLTIDAGVETATPGRVILNDSLYGTTNWQTTANLLIGGNATIGGYITTDSVIAQVLTISGNLTAGGIIKATTTGNVGFVANTNVSGNPYIDFSLGDTLKGNIFWDRTNGRLTINNVGVGTTYIASNLTAAANIINSSMPSDSTGLPAGTLWFDAATGIVHRKY